MVSNVSKSKILDNVLKDVIISKKAKSFPGRAWSGKLKKVDEYLSALYEHMSDSDKNLKDKIFQIYYRYYNDGDIKAIPVKNLKLNQKMQDMYADYMSFTKSVREKKWNADKYEEVLEAAVESVMRKLMTKYKGVISRAKVNYDKYKDIMKTIISYDYNEPYWLEALVKRKDNPEIAAIAKKLKEQRDKWYEDFEKKQKDLDYGSKERNKIEKEKAKAKPVLNKADIDKLKKLMKEDLFKKQQLLKLEDLI